MTLCQKYLSFFPVHNLPQHWTALCPAPYPKDVAKIFVPFIPEVQQTRFETLARDAATSRAEVKALLARAQRAVEIAIEEGEAAGMKLLET